MGSDILVNTPYTLGNRGPICGEQLYSTQVNPSLAVPDLGVFKPVLDTIGVVTDQGAPPDQGPYAISSSNSMFIDPSMIELDGDSKSSVNITQLVYTLVGCVKALQYQVAALESSNSI